MFLVGIIAENYSHHRKLFASYDPGNLTHPTSCISESYIKINNNLNFYFHTSRCLKRFNEGLKGLDKTFWGTTKKCENKNLS